MYGLWSSPIKRFFISQKFKIEVPNQSRPSIPFKTLKPLIFLNL
jgi:hypothetical protein